VDALLLLGRVLSWEKKYDSARTALQAVLEKKPGYHDARDALISMERWSNNYREALSIVKAGLARAPKRRAFRLAKVRILLALDKKELAELELDNLVSDEPDYSEAVALRKKIFREEPKYEASGDYQLITFEKKSGRKPWHLYSAGLTRDFGRFSITGRMAGAHRFDKDGFQLELESYPKVHPNVYLYTAAAVAPEKISNSLFPDFRAGLETFASLPLSTEVSAGFRYLFFNSPGNWIFTGSFGGYLSNWWISVRSFFSPKKISYSRTLLGFCRYYYGGEDDFVELRGGTGMSPDDKARNNHAKYVLDFHHSAKVGLGLQNKLAGRIVVKGGGDFERDEIATDKFRNNWSLKSGLKVEF
jgi:YaiO family outer membrane protein